MLVRANAECFNGNGFRAKGAIFDFQSSVPEGEPDPDLSTKKGEQFPLFSPLTEAEIAAYWAEKEEALSHPGTLPPDVTVMEHPSRRLPADVGATSLRPAPKRRGAALPRTTPADSGSDLLT